MCYSLQRLFTHEIIHVVEGAFVRAFWGFNVVITTTIGIRLSDQTGIVYLDTVGYYALGGVSDKTGTSLIIALRFPLYINRPIRIP